MKIQANDPVSKKVAFEINLDEIQCIIDGLLSLEQNDQTANLRRLFNFALQGKNPYDKMTSKHKSKKTNPCPHCERMTRGEVALVEHISRVHQDKINNN